MCVRERERERESGPEVSCCVCVVLCLGVLPVFSPPPLRRMEAAVVVILVMRSDRPTTPPGAKTESERGQRTQHSRACGVFQDEQTGDREREQKTHQANAREERA